MTIREVTVAKLSQLPEPLLKEVNNFIDFMVMKHQLELKNSDEPVSISDRWLRWFEAVDRLEISPIEPVNEYEQGLLRKYRQQGLEL